jgi:hypothetical protein
MAALAHPQSAPYPTLRRGAALPVRPYRTAVLTAMAVVAGALVISLLMTVSMLMAGTSARWDTAPLAEPVPQPSAAQGFDL